jgi:hypothetical protein
VSQRFKVQLNKIVTFMRAKKGPLETSWVDFGFAEMVSLLNTMDFRFKDHNLHIQNYAGRIFALPQFIVYRKSTRFHERPYNGMGALYK